MSAMAPQVVVSHIQLEKVCSALLEALRCPPLHASLVAKSLVEANLQAVDSHGVQMLPQYISQIEAGGIVLNRVGQVVSQTGSCMLFDGQNGIGQVIAHECSKHAARIASEHGISLVVARRSNHFGAAAFWAMELIRQGFIALIVSNASPAVMAWQGVTPVFGTNPICFGAPCGSDSTWVFDMATTTVALGKLAHAANLELETIPKEWGFLDETGEPTTNTAAARRGMPSPLGRYKGTGLAMMVEVLSGVLSGGLFSTQVPTLRTGSEPLGVSHTFIAIDPNRFAGIHEFEDRMKALIEIVRSSDHSLAFHEVLVPGDLEERARNERLANGIPLPRKLWRELCNQASRLGVVLSGS